jgi:hypothetical protein
MYIRSDRMNGILERISGWGGMNGIFLGGREVLNPIISSSESWKILSSCHVSSKSVLKEAQL